MITHSYNATHLSQWNIIYKNLQNNALYYYTVQNNYNTVPIALQYFKTSPTVYAYTRALPHAKGHAFSQLCPVVGQANKFITRTNRSGPEA